MKPSAATAATEDRARHDTRVTTERPEPLAEIRAFVEAHRMKEKFAPGAFEEFETKLHEKMQALERDFIAEVMNAADVDAEAIEIDGKGHRRVLRSAQTYM